MPVKVTWLGHNTWEIESEGQLILLDPFLNDSPTCPKRANELEPNFILISHGHDDHISDAVALANRTSATVVTNFEIGNWLKDQGVAEENIIGMNIGGGVDLPFGRLKMTIAHHTSSFPDGSYAGVPAGFLIHFKGGEKVYFACDTGLFIDMKLIGIDGLDLAVLPIGDLFTMGPADSVEAVRLLNPKKVLPCHYNTWPPIGQDAEAWARSVKRNTPADPVVLEPGESMLV